MFQFPGFTFIYLFIHYMIHELSHVGFPIRKSMDQGYLRLPEAYRSLSRPSSAPGAKASTMRSL